MKIGTLCYLQNNNSTLMLYRNKKENDIHKNKWNGLGGKLESGESPEECIVREVNEESGYDINNPTLRGIMTFPKFDMVNDWIVFLYTCSEFSGNIIDSNEGELEWIKDENLLDLNLWEGDKIFMKWINEKPFFSAKFIYKNRKLDDYSVIFYE
jgi:8-oxo-dGTP diphosphatase|tara:strand:- start:1340 stop:1801 length:462 start_codon:yes stop_codon:yes gene_type:complete